jgi:energy-converting hydrogenase Eha subunit C
VLVKATEAQISLLQLGLVDLLNAGVAQQIEFASHASEQISTTVRLVAQ